MLITAILKKKYREETGKSEWALVSKSNDKVLKWFGAKKPSSKSVLKEERRVQRFKHKGNMDRKHLIRKVIAKLNNRQVLGFKFLDWIKEKFNINVPTKEEAKKILKDITKEDIQKAYKYIPQMKKEIITSFSFEGIKKYIMILVALAVIAGGTLPASATEANQVCQENCQVKESPFKEYSFKQEVPIKFFKSLKEPKDLNDIKNQALKEMKPVFLENGIKVPSIDKIKLFDQDNKEIKDMKDYYKTLSNSMSADSILMLGD